MTRQHRQFLWWLRTSAYGVAGVGLLIVTQLLPSYDTFKGGGFFSIVMGVPIAAGTGMAFDVMVRGGKTYSRRAVMLPATVLIVGFALISCGLGALLQQRDFIMGLVYMAGFLIGFALFVIVSKPWSKDF